MKSQFKRKLFLIFIMVFMFIPSMFILTSCGGNNKTTITSTNPDVSFIGIEYIGDKQSLKNNNTITYSEGLSINISEFKVTINYTDGTKKDITSGLSLKIYKMSGTSDELVTNLLPGSYKAVIEYDTNKLEYHFTVEGIALDETKVTTTLEESYQFNPNAKIEPTFSISYGSTLLVEDTDYTILYYGPNNTVGEDAGSVYVQFIGIYTGTATFTFDITPISVEDLVFTNKTFTYDLDGKDYRGEVEINLATNPIVGVDRIEYTYKLNNTQVYEVKNVGTYNVTAKIYTSAGFNPVDDKSFTITINPFDISTIDLADYVPDGINVDFCFHEFEANDFEAYVNVYMTDIPHTIEMSSGEGIDNYNASTSTTHGQFKIIATQNSNYTGSITANYIINKVNVQNVSVSLPDFSDLVYDGTEKKIASVQLYLYWDDDLGESIYAPLTENTDYTIEYENNIHASNDNTLASYTITGINNFTGTATGEFYISQKIINLDTSLISFANTSVKYDGTDKRDELFVLDYSQLPNGLPEQVQVKFMDNTYNGEEIGELINANANNGGIMVYAVFSIKNDLANDYFLSATTDSIWNALYITPIIVGNSEQFANPGTEFHGGDGSETTYYYTYDKSNHTPKVVITAKKCGADYTLVEGTDYVISYYYGYFGNELNAAKNANDDNHDYYYVNISYVVEISENQIQNYAVDVDPSGYYVQSSRELKFEIKKKELASTALDSQWPEAFRYVWHSQAFFDVYEKTITFEKEVTVNGETIDATFKLVLTNRYGYIQPYVDENKEIGVQCVMHNYSISNSKISPTLVSPFTTFNLNGTPLTITQIDSLGELTLGDELEMVAQEGQIITYYAYASSTYTLRNTDQTKLNMLTVIIGTYLNPDYSGENDYRYLYETYYRLGVSTIVDNEEETITGTGDVNILSSIFEKFAEYDGSELSQNYNYAQLEGWNIHAGYTVKMSFAEGMNYTVDYTITHASGDPTVISNAESINYTIDSDGKDTQITFTIRNKLGHEIYTFTYNLFSN